METENILEKGLLVELGIEDAAPEVQESVLDSFTGAVIKKMLIRAFELLPEDKKGELVALQDSEDYDKIEQFLKENVPDFDKVMAEVVGSAKEEYRDTVEELTK